MGVNVFNLQNACLCNNYRVSDIFRIGVKSRGGAKLTRRGKNPLGRHKRDSKLYWDLLLTSHNLKNVGISIPETLLQVTQNDEQNDHLTYSIFGRRQI